MLKDTELLITTGTDKFLKEELLLAGKQL